MTTDKEKRDKIAARRNFKPAIVAKEPQDENRLMFDRAVDFTTRNQLILMKHHLHGVRVAYDIVRTVTLLKPDRRDANLQKQLVTLVAEYRQAFSA